MFDLNLVAQRFRSIALISIVSVVTVVVTACSGGGGGGGNSDPNKLVQLELPPVEFKIVYSGSTVVAPLNLSDANIFFSLAWGDPINLPPLVERSTQTPRMTSVAENAAATTIIRATRRAAKISSQNKQASAAVVSVNQAIKGVVSGTMMISGARNVDGTGVVTLTYQNFNDGDGVIYDGQIIELIRAYDRDFDLATDASMEMDLLKIQSSNNAVSISGKFDEKFDLTTLVDTYTFNVDGVIENTKEGFRYQNFISTVFYSETGSAVSESFSGRVFLASQGFVDVTTAAPLTCLVCPNLNPDNGGPVILVGKNQSRAKISPRSETRVRVEVDEDGDLTYEKSALYLWANLTGDAVPNHAPSVAAIKINPDSAFIDSELSMVTQPATDEDGDPLTISYQWLKNGVVLSSATQSMLPAKSFVKKDVIEARLIVSDGIDTTQQTASVTIKNSIPVAGTPTFNSSKVYVTDTLTVIDPLVIDADSDSLTFSYAWLVNGTAINSARSPSLSLAKLKKADAVMAKVTVSDGDDVVTVATLEMVISDSPPVITSSPPAMSTYGSAVAFSATAKDADNDPIQFSLVYGPTNMTVTSVGQVNWTSELPMFDKTVDVHFGIRATAATLTSDYDGMITVTDKTRASPLARTGIAYGSSDIRIADFDGDGKNEILLSGGNNPVLNILQKDSTGEYVQQWVYPFDDVGSVDYNYVITQLRFDIADLNGDGHPDIVFSKGDKILFIDGVTKTTFASLSNKGVATQALSIADIDRDGILDLVLLKAAPLSGATQLLEVYNAKTRAFEWSLDLLANANSSAQALTIGNVDNDAALEIITNTGYVIDGKTHAIEWSYPAFGFSVCTGDIDGDGVDEIVALQDHDGRALVYSAKSKQIIGTITKTGYWDIRSVLVADLDGDGKAEIVIGELGELGVNGYIRAFTFDKKSNTYTNLWNVDAKGSETSALGFGDADSDGLPDLIWDGDGAGYGVPLVVATPTAPITVKWTNEQYSPSFFKISPFTTDGPYFGGEQISGPGKVPRLVFFSGSVNGGYDPGRSIVLDPISGATIVGKQIDPQAFSVHSHDVVDVDGDGQLDVVIGVETNLGAYIAKLDPYSTALSWNVAPGSWQVRNIHHVDINKDGRNELMFFGGDTFASSSTALKAFNTVSKSEIWRSESIFSGYDFYDDVLQLDSNGDGYQDELVGSATKLVLYINNKKGAFTRGLELSAPTGTDTLKLAKVRISNQGLPNIVAVYQNGVCGFDIAPIEIRMIDPATLTPLSSFKTAACTNTLEPTPNTGRQNIIIGSGSTISEIDPITGKTIWQSPRLLGEVARGSLHYNDVYNDGKPHLVFGTTVGMYVTR